MESRDQIIERYLNSIKDKNKDDDRQNLLDNQIKNKPSEEIATYLTSIPAEENGGLTAISGFYYQFLVTIEYILEMLEGKWDYVVMEHHDDVVVGKENHIRFIQVKTSEKIKIDVTASPASGIYSRGSKTIGKDTFRKNDSWVDKLISNAEIAPKSSGFKTEFQLYSSYHFIKTREYNLDIYTDNKGYDKVIPLDDNLFKKISEPVRDKEGVPYIYEDICGEKVPQLLSRFYIRTGLSLSEMETFKNHLCMKLNKWLFKDIGSGITMQIEDLHMLIGHLCTKCTYKNDPEVLMITKESVEQILGEIRIKSIAAASLATNKHDSVQITNRVIDDLLKQLEESDHIGLIQDKLYMYKEYLMEWISEGGNIRQLLERYIDGTTRTSIYSKLGDTDREVRLQELFHIILILIIGRESFLRFTTNRGLLSKQCETKNQMFSFFSMEKKKNIKTVLQKLESIVKSYDLDEHLFLIDKDLYIVVQNYNDRKFISSMKWRFSDGSDLDIQEFDNDLKLNKVPLEANIIPGEMLIADFLDSIEEKTNIQESLKEIWGNYQGGEI
ncbi:dsDNA nuclease domain-containing protein [Priestia aryabhattai]|uniref:dsDNA nuclease domain-containing protein n=1 Tax=Priestia aryabhattai TaxID=412384 RepID=UPI001CFD9145|nr:dsDNA nuclease domain-containing protein [Priestia aryabhattai]